MSIVNARSVDGAIGPSTRRRRGERSRALRAWACFLVLSGGLSTGLLSRLEAGASSTRLPVSSFQRLPKVLTRETPGSLEDLKSLERHLERLVAEMSPCVVAVDLGGATGSGVVISPDGLVLTAAHLCGEKGREVRIQFPDGRNVRGKTLGAHLSTDAGLMKIAEPGPWPHALMGDLSDARAGDWALALGHPGGFDARRPTVARLGRIIGFTRDTLRTDCILMGGDSGGPVFDMKGWVIGINSRISVSATENYHVAISTFKDVWTRLVRGDRWGTDTESGGQDRGIEGIAALGDRLLDRDRFKNGAYHLKVLSALSIRARHSVVKLDINGGTVALATVVGENGVAVTKASELRDGTLTAWLPGGREVPVERLGLDKASDLALVRIAATNLVPVRWAEGDVRIGQWTVTTGIEEWPHAVGIVSVGPRRIRPARAFIGVRLDFEAPAARIAEVLPGLGAEQAGLKAGDTIESIDAIRVTNGQAAVEVLSEYAEGSSVQLQVRRGNELLDASIRMMIPEADRSRRGSGRGSRRDPTQGSRSSRAEDFASAIQHDTVLQPWLCGGPLLNLEGAAIGLNIARAGRVATYALPASLVREAVSKLSSAVPPR